MAIFYRILYQVAHRAPHQRGAQLQAQPPGFLEADILPQIVEVGDHRIDQRVQVDIGFRLAGPPHAGEREDILQRLVHLGDGVGHAQPVLLVLHRLDPHPERGEWRAQVVPDRAEHPILFLQHRPDAQAQRVERRNQAGHVERPLFGDGLARYARVKAFGGTGQVA